VKAAILMTIIALFLSLSAQSQTLYGTTVNGPGSISDLYSIDVVTDAETLIGSIGFGRCSDIASDPITGIKYSGCERPGDGTPVLVSIVLTTGAGTEIGPMGTSGVSAGLAFRADGTLFLFDADNDPEHTLFTVDLTTGTTTLVGDTGLDGDGGNGIAFAPDGTLHHMANNSGFNSIDPATGAVTNVAANNLVPAGRISGMSFDASGVLYAIVKSGGGGSGSAPVLMTVDPTTGTTISVITAAPYTVGMSLSLLLLIFSVVGVRSTRIQLS